LFCKSQELNSNEFKRSNHVEFSENSYEDKEKSFTPLEQEYDDFDPLEYLGVYNNDKKIEDVHNSSENESDFEKRFFENENTNNLYNLANRNSYQIKSKRLKGLSDNYEISNSPKDNEIINRKKNNSLLNFLNLDENLKIKSKRKLNKLCKSHKASKENIENTTAEVKIEYIEEESKIRCAETSPLKESLKFNYKNINSTQKDSVLMNNNNFANEENRTFDRVEFFKKFRRDSIKETSSLNKEDSINIQNNLIPDNSQSNLNQKININNTNDTINSKVFNFSDMGSKLKSNLSLTFNPNNSNKSANNNKSMSQLNTNLFHNNCGNINPFATCIFSLSNGANNMNSYLATRNNNHYSDKKEEQFENFNNANRTNNYSKNKDKPMILGYTNELINKINSNQLGLNSNSSSRNSQNNENKKAMCSQNSELNFQKEFLSKKNSNRELEVKDAILTSDNKEINLDPKTSLAFETVPQHRFNSNLNFIKVEVKNDITPSVSLKNKICNSNNTPKKVKRIPFVRITPERILKEKANIPKSNISISKITLNLPQSPSFLGNEEEKKAIAFNFNQEIKTNNDSNEFESSTLFRENSKNTKNNIENSEGIEQSKVSEKVDKLDNNLNSISSKKIKYTYFLLFSIKTIFRKFG